MAYFVVLEHVHDPEAGIYRLVVGLADDVEQPMLDEQDQAILDDEGQVMTETVTTTMPVTDFVWADDDERWEGRDDDWIAKSQRESAKRALERQERELLEAQSQKAAPRTIGEEGKTL